MPKEIHGSLWLEMIWTVIPLGIVILMFAWGRKLFFQMNRPPDDAMDVCVVGKQWMWKLQHPNGQREINELHVPVGQPVKLTMTSEDVIHSFFVPAFRIKQDVVPGRYTTAWFEATKVGQLPPVLRRVLRHRALEDGRHGRGDGAGRLRGLARAADRRAESPGGRGRAAVRRARLRHLPPPRLRRARARS